MAQRVIREIREVTHEDVRGLLRERVTEAGSQRAYSQAHGVHEAMVSVCLNGAKPSRSILLSLGVRTALVIEGDAR